MEGFYRGFLHPYVSFDQLLALLGWGVMLGLGRSSWSGRGWWAFAAFTAIGMCFGLLRFVSADTSLWLLLIGFLSATIAAIRPSGVLAVFLILAALAGALVGFASIPDPGPLRDTVITVIGSFVGANIGLIYCVLGTSWFLERFKQAWSQVAVRILAAWIATISISMAALTFAAR